MHPFHEVHMVGLCYVGPEESKMLSTISLIMKVFFSTWEVRGKEWCCFWFAVRCFCIHLWYLWFCHHDCEGVVNGASAIANQMELSYRDWVTYRPSGLCRQILQGRKMSLFTVAVLFLIDYDGAQLVCDDLKQLLSALSSYRRRRGTQTHSSSMPGSFKPCGFRGKTADWICTHTETVWNAERLQQTTSPSQGANMKYYSIFLC